MRGTYIGRDKEGHAVYQEVDPPEVRQVEPPKRHTKIPRAIERANAHAVKGPSTRRGRKALARSRRALARLGLLD